MAYQKLSPTLQNYRIRPLSHFGSYPSDDIEIGSDLLFKSDQLLFTCTKNKMTTEYGETHPDQPAFELENWTLQEVRFFASLYLGNGPYRSCRLYPLSIFQDMPISSPNALAADSNILHKLVLKMHTDNYFMYANSGLIPTNISDYDFIDWGDHKYRQAKLLWKRIDTRNSVLVRSLYSLLKSEMLFNHFQFRTASLSEVHISLDGAHSLILSILRQQGIENPTSRDAGKYFEDIFESTNTGRSFFQDYYEDRIRNFHVDSRFGAEPIPNFSVDDVWDLQNGLRELFYTLITNERFNNALQ